MDSYLRQVPMLIDSFLRQVFMVINSYLRSVSIVINPYSRQSSVRTSEFTNDMDELFFWIDETENIMSTQLQLDEHFLEDLLEKIRPEINVTSPGINVNLELPERTRMINYANKCINAHAHPTPGKQNVPALRQEGKCNKKYMTIKLQDRITHKKAHMTIKNRQNIKNDAKVNSKRRVTLSAGKRPSCTRPSLAPSRSTVRGVAWPRHQNGCECLLSDFRSPP
ncbi:hypothetical protein DPMN_045893 [Dreissena polymorpha]|uniref:Uncharacterized protein n=1 Tax=Dreissena polymorpha TaxID=45954 RepID=A0A9D4D6T8_DREPO|nr:hypothetical protein DPMN_045893 [Dreissena polymorpha]